MFNTLYSVNIAVTDFCSKGCVFCYNKSNSKAQWDIIELVNFIRDLAQNGIPNITLGGGEPFEWEPIYYLLAQLKKRKFNLSITSNGLNINYKRLSENPPDLLRLSLHNPTELDELVAYILIAQEYSINIGVNILYTENWRPKLETVINKFKNLDVTNILFLPLHTYKGWDVKPENLLKLAKTHQLPALQVSSCVMPPVGNGSFYNGCGAAEWMVSVGADRRLKGCSMYKNGGIYMEKLSYEFIASNMYKIKKPKCFKPNLGKQFKICGV